MSVFRVYVEKKKEFAVKAKNLKNDINNVKKHLEQVEKLKLEYPFLNKLLESKN